MPKFRKKPVEIEAHRIDLKTTVHTLNGPVVAEPGEWIVTGVAGEVYPCADAIFRATYEPTDDEARRALDE